MFVNSNQHISVSNQKLQVCVSYNLNWLLTIFREELDAPGEAFYGLGTASSCQSCRGRGRQDSQLTTEGVRAL